MRVLITLDGSELSSHALEALAPWVRTWNAETVLLTVLDPAAEHATVEGVERRLDLPAGHTESQALRGIPIEPELRLAEDRGQALEAARVAAEEAMADQAKEHLGDLPWRVAAIFAGDVPEAIALFAEDEHVDFVAMSTHGRSGLGQAVFGSVASEVMRRLKVPGIIVGAHVVATPPKRGAELAAAR